MAPALRFFEVLHHLLPVRVKRIEAVRRAASTVPLTFSRQPDLPLLIDVPEETLLFASTLYQLYFGKLLSIQLKRGECLPSLRALVWPYPLAISIPHLLGATRRLKPQFGSDLNPLDRGTSTSR